MRRSLQSIETPLQFDLLSFFADFYDVVAHDSVEYIHDEKHDNCASNAYSFVAKRYSPYADFLYNQNLLFACVFATDSFRQIGMLAWRNNIGLDYD